MSMETEQKAEGLTPAQNAEIALAEVQKLSDGVPEKIKTEAELNAANELLAQIRKTTKAIKAQKDPVIKSLEEQKKTIRSWFAPAEERAAAVENTIKAAILDYNRRLEQAAARRAKAIENKVDEGKMSISEGMAKISTVKQAPTSVRTASGGTTVRVTKKLRIIDPSALPAGYFLRPRVLEALRQEVQIDVFQMKLDCPPGAEVYEEKGLAVSTN
jgi:hypothetical protein